MAASEHGSAHSLLVLPSVRYVSFLAANNAFILCHLLRFLKIKVPVKNICKNVYTYILYAVPSVVYIWNR